MGSSRSTSSPGTNASDQRQPYQYEPLDRATDTFRLITILPCRSEKGLIQLSLRTEYVLSASYCCLSYRWGSQTRRHGVLIEGALFHVGENLYNFFEESVKWPEFFDIAWWVDSICIDQTCADERSHQVQRMGRIYASAKQVFIWLGCGQFLPDALDEWVRAENATDLPEGLQREWRKIRSNPYWQRAWIVQEVLLAKNVHIILPGSRVEYRLLGRAIARSADVDQLENDTAAQLWTFWHDKWYRPKHRGHGPTTIDWVRHERNRDEFWRLMHMHKNAKCADRRDRVYSLMGLISGSHGFQVDYRESAADLFWRVGEHFDAWVAPELVDIMRVALLGQASQKTNHGGYEGIYASPWILIESLRARPDFQVRVPVRRASPTSAWLCRITKQVQCKFKDCRRAPPLRCTSSDMLLCTNTQSDSLTEHGCIHGLAYPTDKPAAEPFEIRLEAHHGKTIAHAVLPSTALQVLDIGTNTWVGISTWSSLRKALNRQDLDRADRVKLLIPAKYAIWIWFGVHPDQLDSAVTGNHPSLPSAHHTLPPGTKVTRKSIELPSMSPGTKGEALHAKNGIFGI
jgi:hypothetical protein